MLTEQQIEFWLANGYLRLEKFYPPQVVEAMKAWAYELSEFPQSKGKWMLYYEQSLMDTCKILCRIENFLDYHEQFRNLLFDKDLIAVLTILIEETPCLFKEKINFKFPGANGFSPHQDAPAFAIFNQQYHVTVMISIDAATEANGCLEFAGGRHKEGLFPQKDNGDLSPEVVEGMNWNRVLTNEGDIVIFDSFVPHKSSSNLTDKPRRAVFATYNRLSDKEKRSDYYREKRVYFPPEYERKEGFDYTANNPFNLGNPIK